MSCFVELTHDEMNDIRVLLMHKSQQWAHSGKKDCAIYARYYECLAEKFQLSELDDR